MGRTYAGVLGLLAFATTVARGLINGGGFGSTMTTAVAYLIVFAVIGAIVGGLADWTVADSIRSSLQAEAKTEPAKQTA